MERGDTHTGEIKRLDCSLTPRKRLRKEVTRGNITKAFNAGRTYPTQFINNAVGIIFADSFEDAVKALNSASKFVSGPALTNNDTVCLALLLRAASVRQVALAPSCLQINVQALTPLYLAALNVRQAGQKMLMPSQWTFLALRCDVTQKQEFTTQAQGLTGYLSTVVSCNACDEVSQAGTLRKVRTNPLARPNLLVLSSRVSSKSFIFRCERNGIKTSLHSAEKFASDTAPTDVRNHWISDRTAALLRSRRNISAGLEHNRTSSAAATHPKPTIGVESWMVKVEKRKASEVYGCIFYLKHHRATVADDVPIALIKVLKQGYTYNRPTKLAFPDIQGAFDLVERCVQLYTLGHRGMLWNVVKIKLFVLPDFRTCERRKVSKTPVFKQPATETLSTIKYADGMVLNFEEERDTLSFWELTDALAICHVIMNMVESVDPEQTNNTKTYQLPRIFLFSNSGKYAIEYGETGGIYKAVNCNNLQRFSLCHFE
ncbi:hypothetical protein CLF_102099, partial [Clonorchis sinensis]